ncbi:MAG: hypothetical protein ABIT58_02810 [Ferruginibacter sp.]
MKKIIFSLLFISATGITTYAQCNQTVTFNTSQTEYQDGKGSVAENTAVVFDNQDIKILTNGNVDDQLTGTVLSSSCDWKKSYREGKTILKTSLSNKKMGPKNATLTMEGKDGNVSLLVEMDNMPAKKFQLTAEAFKEQQ